MTRILPYFYKKRKRGWSFIKRDVESDKLSSKPKPEERRKNPGPGTASHAIGYCRLKTAGKKEKYKVTLTGA